MSNVIHDSEVLIQTVRIESIYQSGKVSVGTGFPYAFLVQKIDEKKRKGVRAIVTNRHVIEDKQIGTRVESGYFYINKRDASGRCDYGNKVKIEFKGDEWIHHPDVNVDLSVLPINDKLAEIETKGEKLFFVSDLHELVPSDEREWSRIGPLEDIITVGYPNGLWDEENNLPIARKGITSTYARQNYKNKEQFVLDVPIFPGISGSPVYAMSYGNEFYESGGWAVGSKCLLIGILFGGLKYRVGIPGADLSVIPTDNRSSDINDLISQLGVAVKSTKLKDFDKVLKK